MRNQPVPFGVTVIRSERRTKTSSAHIEGNRIIVRIPASLTKEEEEETVAELSTKVVKKDITTVRTNEQLVARAKRLNKAFLQSQARADNITFVRTQKKRWGSCKPSTGQIRINDRLRWVPDFALNSVIIHELVHTFVPNHSIEFRFWVNRYPAQARAEGYLEAFGRWAPYGKEDDGRN